MITATSTPTSRPRVLHLSPVPFGPLGTFGGGERYPYELSKAMARRVPTTYASFSRSSSHRTVDGLSEVMLATRHKFSDDNLNPVSEQLITLLAHHDVVHIHQWDTVYGNIAALAAVAMRRNVFVTDHGGWARNHRRRLRIHRLVDASINVSDFAASFYPEFAARHATVLGGVDTERYQPTPDAPRGDHVLFVGRLLPHKGIDVLIDSLPDRIPLRVVGRPYDPAFFEHLRERATGKAVTFVLDADDDAVVREYQTARAVILPSLLAPASAPAAPKSELLGLTLIEAMACGTPVVCTRTGGMPEVVLNGVSGIVVEPGDHVALSSAIRHLHSADDWTGWSEAAREHVMRNLTWNATADRCLRFYAQLARGGAAHSY